MRTRSHRPRFVVVRVAVLLHTIGVLSAVGAIKYLDPHGRALFGGRRCGYNFGVGIGANLATAYQNYSVASYQWNASWFATFVDQAAAWVLGI